MKRQAVTAVGRPAWARRWPARLAWVLWTLVLLGPPVDVWLTQLARQAGRIDLGSNAETAIYGLLAVSAATVGAVLVFSSLQRYFVRGLTAGAVGG